MQKKIPSGGKMFSINIIMLVFFSFMSVRKRAVPVYGRIYRNGAITYLLCLLGTFLLSVAVNWLVYKGYATTPDELYNLEIFKTIGLVIIIVANLAPITILVRQTHRDMMSAVRRFKEKGTQEEK